MPFKSIAQRNFCYRTHLWDCKKWDEHTPNLDKLPYRVSQKGGEKVYVGSRGGKYILKKGKKVYIKFH